LEKLNEDIDFAGIDGEISSEAYTKLIDRALDYMIEPERARPYIEAYCKEKEWSIKTTPAEQLPWEKAKVSAGADKRSAITSKMGKHTKIALLIVLIIGLGAFGYGLMNYLKTQKAKSAYQAVLAKIDGVEQPYKKIMLLEKFVSSYADSEYAKKAGANIKQIKNTVEEQFFKQLQTDTKLFAEQGQYAKAITTSQNHLKKFPNGRYVKEVTKKISDLKREHEEKDFQQLQDLGLLSSDKKIRVYTQFLKHHPQGVRAKKVQQRIQDMAEEYYIFIKRKISSLEEQEKWGKCIQMCTTYIEAYPKNERANEFKKLQAYFQERSRDWQLFSMLKQKAAQLGDDFAAARQIYEDHLRAYPSFYEKKRAESEIEKLNQQEDSIRLEALREKIRSKLKDLGNRFDETQPGVIKDKKTGLSWSMLDSYNALQSCLDYETTLEYADQLNLGGYSDWRVPSEKELAAIYKTQPFFPVLQENWYWTSESFKRWDGGWRKDVKVVTSHQETNWKTIRQDSLECGAVRAVR